MAGFSFGSGFQPTTQTSTPSFGGFGAPATTQTGTAFGFGAPAKTTGFGFSGFGATTTTTAPTFGTGFGFGTPATTTGGFSFGQPTASTATGAPFSFTQPTTATTAATGFGFGQPSGFSFGTQAAPKPFGTATSTPGFSFGTGLGGGFGTAATTTQSSLLGGGSLFSTGFGTGASAPTGFGVPTSATAAPANNVANIAAALSLPAVFNDERDPILAKWNQLQAFWGTGKGYFSASAPPVVFTPENPFCRFKAIGYSALPVSKPEEGLVSLVFHKKVEELQPLQLQIVEGLHRLLGSKPTLSVCVDGLKGLAMDKCELVIYLVERSPTGAARRIPSNELSQFLGQMTVKPQLTQLGVQNVIPKAAPSKEWIKQYLDNPPCGIDALLWQQAKLDNPDPEKLIPVPMIGFAELRRRFKLQEHEIKQHQNRLDIIAEDIAELQRQQATTIAKIEEQKRKHTELSHRTLQVMVRQEVTRKLGFGIQPEEEQLRVVLESTLAELSAPTQFKGRLNELVSQIKMQNNQVACSSVPVNCSLDERFIDEMKTHLKNQQDGIGHLIKILKSDIEDLKGIEAGLQESAVQRR
ncbi:nuclear pore complex protein Nup54-like [Ornithodoros turicata]|uniref:Putative nuclear pore complex p54 component sc nup57 n=1 Tax=Ornithodoros turicata TaxID=34597 RepID=A0A2R5LEM6_9ACAR